VTGEHLPLGQVATSLNLDGPVVEVRSPIGVCSHRELQGERIAPSAQVESGIDEDAVAWPPEVGVAPADQVLDRNAVEPPAETGRKTPVTRTGIRQPHPH